MKKEERGILIAGISIFLAAMLILSVNLSTREKYELNELQKEELLKIFPEGHLNKIKFYKGGLYSIKLTKVVCQSVYINPKTSVDFIKDENSSKSLALLVHETIHTLQNKRGCIREIASITTDQIKFINQGEKYIPKTPLVEYIFQLVKYLDRKNLEPYYFYSLSIPLSELNPEQEATIVEDYYLLNFGQGEIEDLFCTDCQTRDKEELKKILEQASIKILGKYKRF